MSEAPILVTGGAGYIGGHTVLALADRGLPAVVLDNLWSGYRNDPPAGVPLVTADVSDAETVADVIRRYGVKTVMHFAGYIDVAESVRHPAKYYANNTSATLALVETCAGAGIETFLFSSTTAVYGIPETVPIAETEALRPITPYGASKMMAERIIADVAGRAGMNWGVLRYFNVAGSDAQGRAGQVNADIVHVIRRACETALGLHDSFTIFGDDYDTPDGTCIRDFIHVSDLADVHVAALQHIRRTGTDLTLNCGYGQGFSVKEVVRAVAEVSGVDVPVDIGPRREGDVADVVADTGRLFATLDWRPRFSTLEEIVRSTYEWERRRLETARR